MNRRLWVLIALGLPAAAVAGLLLPAARSDAGADKVAFPANCKVGQLYTIADRYDVKQYRELYTTPAAIPGAQGREPPPRGALLTPIPVKGPVDAPGGPPPRREAGGS